jgi:hypothetical protein
MASTIISSFTKLRSNLEITGLQSTTVSQRQSNVREVLDAGLTVHDSFLTGSYIRSTMVSPLKEADIDIFAVLDASYYELGAVGLLDKVRKVLLKTYTQSPKISRNGQAVTITFSDFVVDVVPAFRRDGGGYLIPTSYTNQWIATDPTRHITYLSEQNKHHSGDLVPFIKMVKGWNRNNGKPFTSFYLELLAAKILHNVTLTDFSSGMRFFFDKGREQCKWSISDPAGFGDNILSGMNQSDAISRFETAYNRAVKAEEFATNYKVEDAVNEWRKIFGDYFPAYG